ncbi:DEAD/DEAH box helicase [Stieleria varia]|uniref:ATP-dependent helicase HepA n=1 Tax=Stieleria varia TaxID=2528005 RepID=A0A5C6B8M0_9BACT|nr:DEAD/DEAH box helicase [Stieleria varia]TWU08310.1 ATP-dependent helicase HepA [Stieleria varia]
MDATLQRICSNTFHPETIRIGEQILREGGVGIDRLGDRGATGVVKQDGEFFIVGLDFDYLDEGDLGADCSCDIFCDGYVCEHVYALFREAANQGYQFPNRGGLAIEDCDIDCIMIGTPMPLRTNKATQRTNAKTPAWKKQLTSIARGLSVAQVETPISDLHLAVRKNTQHWFIISLADQITTPKLEINTYRSTRKMDRQWGKPTVAGLTDHDITNMPDPLERAALTLLVPKVAESEFHFQSRYTSNRCFLLRDDLVQPTMKTLAATGRLAWSMETGRSASDPRPIRWDEGAPYQLQLSIVPFQPEKGAERIRVQPRLVREGEFISIADVLIATDDGVLITQDCAHSVMRDQAAAIRGWQANPFIDVPRRSLATLMAEVATWPSVDLDLHPDLDVQCITPQPIPRLHLVSPESNAGQDSNPGPRNGPLNGSGQQTKQVERLLSANILMIYGDAPIPVQSGQRYVWDQTEKQLLARDLTLESELMQPLRQEDFSMDQFGQLHMPRTRLPDVVPQLSELGWEVIADGNAIRRASSFDIQVSSGQDWFDLNASADYDGVTVMLPHLLAALKKGESYVVLDDGSHGLLPQEWLAKFSDLHKTGTVTDDSIRFTRTQALLLDTMLAEQENVSLDRQFKAWCEKLNSFTGIQPADAPKDFEGELREYQQLGLGWFRFLQEFRLGGCLADDMGLGKTIQVLAMLLERQKRRTTKGETRKPSLIVVPKSLVFNWIDEASRFAPTLQLANYTGTTRKELRDRFHEYDAIVTTYGTLRNDILLLREQEFDYVILDEAQAIKNPKSLAAKASRVVNGEHRLAMTGTPVENHLGDLWSLFDFLNPGMLGQTLGTANTAADGNNEQRITHISKALRPFILRRTKEQVLTELPEKTEQTLHCDMEPKQRKLYNELRDHYRAQLTQKIEKDGLAKSKIQVLEALLRLRQAACDPRLVAPKSGVKGAKILRLVEQLEEVISEGHKALVFSQFTSLLSLVRTELDERGWDYEYLDGKTTKRSQHVERFQTDPNCSLFLISLKAGGSGLNLTAADYVFILDPWWNPAVEAQAIDRAHRMGQTKSVMAYRMICRETVEEKIVQLQSSKRKLADAIISQEKSVISDLSSDDLRMLFS